MVQQSVTPYMNVARIVKTHGRKGEVVVAPLDGLPFCLEVGMRVCLTPPPLRGERFHTVARVGGGGQAIVAFSDASDLNAAEPLAGKLVLALKSDVPDAEEELLLLDCVGCPMVDDVHGEVGVIQELIQLPANDVWRVDGGPYGELLVPVVDEVVLELPEYGEGPVLVHLMPGILPEV